MKIWLHDRFLNYMFLIQFLGMKLSIWLTGLLRRKLEIVIKEKEGKVNSNTEVLCDFTVYAEPNQLDVRFWVLQN